MKKILTLLLCIFALSSCNYDKSFIYSDYWDNTISTLGKTELSITAVMQSADCWVAKIKYYTEPNGKGLEYLGGQVSEEGYIIPPLGGHMAVYTFGENNFREYVALDPTAPNVYKDYEMTAVNDNSFSVEHGDKTTQWKILGYDDNSIIVENDFFTITNEGIEYPYSIVHFVKNEVSDDHWMYSCISKSEFDEYQRKQHEDAWNNTTPEDIEEYIVSRLEKGDTIEQLEEYFKYYCPELYESTIKYILEKYK